MMPDNRDKGVRLEHTLNCTPEQKHLPTDLYWMTFTDQSYLTVS